MHEAQRTMQTADKLNDDSSEDPANCPHWSGEPGEVVMETPLAKRVLVMEMPLAKRVIGDHVLLCDYYDIAS